MTYRDLDVNAYAKGADRRGERIVRSSDGPAFCTSDHYRSFTQFSLSARAPGRRSAMRRAVRLGSRSGSISVT
ncbi:hypothetical protein F1D97_05870 [Cellulomonas palmilytica]|nr:hypothetical protein F1D97_05870 [Cellulomonas palmilytica]